MRPCLGFFERANKLFFKFLPLANVLEDIARSPPINQIIITVSSLQSQGIILVMYHTCIHASKIKTNKQKQITCVNCHSFLIIQEWTNCHKNLLKFSFLSFSVFQLRNILGVQPYISSCFPIGPVET